MNNYLKALVDIKIINRLSAKKSILLILIGFVTFNILYILSAFITPDVNKLNIQNPTTTTFFNYKENQRDPKVARSKMDSNWVPLEKISPNLVLAVVVSEDVRFWKHNGFDWTEMKLAVMQDIKTLSLDNGASTISQQLVKNLYLTPSKNPVRKVREAVITYRLEKNLSKERILEIYLNVVEWGEGIYGAEEAALKYFHKSPAELTLMEATRLAIVLPNPRIYRPTEQSQYINDRVKSMYERYNRIKTAENK